MLRYNFRVNHHRKMSNGDLNDKSFKKTKSSFFNQIIVVFYADPCNPAVCILRVLCYIL